VPSQPLVVALNLAQQQLEREQLERKQLEREQQQLQLQLHEQHELQQQLVVLDQQLQLDERQP